MWQAFRLPPGRPRSSGPRRPPPPMPRAWRGRARPVPGSSARRICTSWPCFRSAPTRRIGRLRTAARPEIEQAVDEALKNAEFEVVTLDWDGFAAGTQIFTTIFLTEAWDTDHALAEAHPDRVGEDIHQTLGMTEMFRPGLEDASSQLDDWRQSL